ncbi:MAG TPA: hypothetical protein VE054_03070, partial [Blattabacteriaceae bacterium]|nr:hypothetical protein [Blattabacteriaceae bacterium]
PGFLKQLMIQGDEPACAPSPGAPDMRRFLRLAGWEPAASRLTNPTTCEMPKRFGAKRQMIQGEAGLRAEPVASRLTNPTTMRDAEAVWSEATK